MADPDETAPDEPFDPGFLSELEGLVAESGVAVSAALHEGPAGVGFRQALADFLAAPPPATGILSEDVFANLPQAALAERTDALLASSRHSPRREAAQAVESFVVFFQALLPTLAEEAAREIKGTFFRLVPTLLHVAWDQSNLGETRNAEARGALRELEAILLEVSSVRLTPAESGLLFKSLDQMATLMTAGEYGLATELVAGPLLAILRRNRLTRSLFRLMEVEVAIQVYLKERLGYTTPQIRIPEDVTALSEYGPVRLFDEEVMEGGRRLVLQIQLPDISDLSAVVLHLVPEPEGPVRDLRLDGLGTVELDLPPGLYRLGLAYEPEGSRGV